MKAYFIRHGSYNPETGDLDGNGIDDVKALHRLLTGLGLKEAKILASPKPRAKQTAEILSGLGKVEYTDLLKPSADPETFYQYLKDESGDVIMVSHNPVLQSLVGLYGHNITLETASCIHLESGILRWIITPSIARLCKQ